MINKTDKKEVSCLPTTPLKSEFQSGGKQKDSERYVCLDERKQNNKVDFMG